MKTNIIINRTATTTMPATAPPIMPIEPPESLELEGGANKFYA